MNIWYTSIFYILYIYIVLAILNIRAKHYEIYIPKCIYLYGIPYNYSSSYFIE